MVVPLRYFNCYQRKRMHIHHRHDSPPQAEADFDARMNGPDGGIVNAWLAGRDLRGSRPDLAAAASAGQLPVLPYRGGVDRPIKRKDKLGSLLYVAMWQGLRSDDLNVDASKDVQLVCTRHGVPVTFTPDWQRLLVSGEEQ